MAKNKFSRVPSDIFPSGVFELQVQYSRRSENRFKFSSADEVATFARSHIYTEGSIEYVEQLYVLMLDRSNQLYAWKQISIGGISATFTDPKLIFQTALLCHAPQIILLHNHPSGNTQPSINDLQMTKRLKEGGDLLEIKILDHLILTMDGFYSFADEGEI
jgi:DNA repair protein RadC